MSQKKIQSTRNYRLFQNNSGENRPLDFKKHKKLFESMKKQGFIDSFPIIITRDSNGHLIVKDGQHRLAFAEKLGLPVYYVEDDSDFDVAEINSTVVRWQLKDFAQKYAAAGIKSYQEGLAFSEQHRLAIGATFALLAGTTSYTNIHEQFIGGTFKVKDRDWAEAVAGIYVPLTAMSKAVKNTRMLEACMRVCRVPDFDAKRLLDNAKRCREKLVAYSQTDPYLQMLEDIYNYGRKQLVGLKAAATMAMRERNPGRIRSQPPEPQSPSQHAGASPR